MPGRVLAEALDLEVPGPAVATYETGAAGVAETARDSTVDPAIMERLRSLGYLGDSDSNRGASETRRSPEGERNLAAVLFEAGRYQESAEAFAKLVEENPEDGSVHTSLAGALGALGRYDEAIRHLDLATQLDPLNVEAYHNRGVIQERQGKPDAAIEEYRTAVRYNPQYEPSRSALVRLTSSADVRAPRNDAEKLASLLAERASQAARRGDYAEAMKLLAEAERIAPRYPVVYQYQSNVFYLMGDLSKAIQVLENALELEPENALFKTNLQRLKTQAAAARR
jgi:tetratricopeptide (TPR) repeat protein